VRTTVGAATGHPEVRGILLGMREFTVTAVKLLDLELVRYLYDDDNEGREIKAVSSCVGDHQGWIAIQYRDDGPSRWVRVNAKVSLRTL